MSATTVRKLFEPVIEAAANAAWNQWSAIGSRAAGSRAPKTVIDPEGLILVSLALLERDQRFSQVLHDWVSVNARVLSVQRLRNISRDFPATTRSRLASLAQVAMMEGHDARWRSLQIATVSKRSQGDGRLPQALSQQFSSTAALWFRMRMGLGVGIKADALTFLLGHADWAPVSEIVQATGYASVAVRRSLEELVSAAFIHSNEPEDWHASRARQYRADRDAWHDVAGLKSVGNRWGHWKDRFAFVAHITDFMEPPNHATKWDAMQLGDHARAFTEQHPYALRFADASSEGKFRGTLEESGVHFTKQMQRLVTWLTDRG